MRSIMAKMGNTQDFPRLKVGIGRPESPKFPIAAWVLSKFDKEEQAVLDDAIDEAVNVVESVLALGMEKANSGVRLN